MKDPNIILVKRMYIRGYTIEAVCQRLRYKTEDVKRLYEKFKKDRV